MVGAVAVVIVVQAFSQAAPFGWIDRTLNGIRELVPPLLVLIAVGTLLLIVAMIHGLVTDRRPDQGAVTLDDRVVSNTVIKKGNLELTYRGRTAVPNQYVLGFLRGHVLWAGGFYEESGLAELKHAWRSGEWLHVRRYLRATLALAGFLLIFVGVFATAALVIDITVLRLLFLLVVAYGLGRTAYAFVRA